MKKNSLNKKLSWKMSSVCINKKCQFFREFDVY